MGYPATIAYQVIRFDEEKKTQHKRKQMILFNHWISAYYKIDAIYRWLT